MNQLFGLQHRRTVPVICENLEVIKTFPIFSLCEKILTPKGMSVAMQSLARKRK